LELEIPTQYINSSWRLLYSTCGSVGGRLKTQQCLAD